jgi:hypothetical protein
VAAFTISGGAYTSNDFEAVCRRLRIQHETIESTQGGSDKNLVETHFNEQRHQAFMQTYNTTAHQGLLRDRRLPPIPVEVLGAATGRMYPQEELARCFSHALFPRTTNRFGCVTLHSYHFYVEEGLPHTSVLLWVYLDRSSWCHPSVKLNHSAWMWPSAERNRLCCSTKSVVSLMKA